MRIGKTNSKLSPTLVGESEIPTLVLAGLIFSAFLFGLIADDDDGSADDDVEGNI